MWPLVLKHNVSDLHLCSAWPARWRIRGRMEAAPFDTPDVEELLREWLDDDQRAILLGNGQLDFARVAGGKPAIAWQRIRATARYFSGVTAVTFALPAARTAWRTNVLPELLKSENGLILVTGATGEWQIYHAGGDGWLSQSTCPMRIF
ncbi:twitching motility family protein [Escherichia coli]|uniref:Twitching motility family protein n=1 Tax=Escherichia coli TaxID=562 RepID=A0A376ZLR9_ECOLX|nr:twitching motility family protein [Escherichia coli]